MGMQTRDAALKDMRYDADPHAHPGLHAIALLEGSKGLLALLAATGLEIFGPTPLRHVVGKLIHLLQLDPRHGMLPSLLAAIDPHAVHLAALLVALYGLLHLVESWGLWHARSWASWLGCISASVYLPFDLYAVATHPGWASLAVLAINIAIVAALARDLFRRRHAGRI